jgi:hypothetical protein
MYRAQCAERLVTREAAQKESSWSFTSRSGINRITEGNSHITIDTFIWKTQLGENVMFKHLTDGTAVFHEQCEGFNGIPSACVKSTSDHNKVVHCFNCHENIYCLPTYCPVIQSLIVGEDYLPARRHCKVRRTSTLHQRAGVSKADQVTVTRLTRLGNSYVAK